MVKILLAVLGLIVERRVVLAELVAAALVVVGVAMLSAPAAWIVAGVLVALKAFEWDLLRDREGRS